MCKKVNLVQFCLGDRKAYVPKARFGQFVPLQQVGKMQKVNSDHFFAFGTGRELNPKGDFG